MLHRPFLFFRRSFGSELEAHQLVNIGQAGVGRCEMASHPLNPLILAYMLARACEQIGLDGAVNVFHHPKNQTPCFVM